VRLDFSADSQAFFVGDWCGAHLAHAFFGGFVIAKIELGTDEDDGNSWSVMFYLGCPLIA
jgi:hypothetical protein